MIKMEINSFLFFRPLVYLDCARSMPLLTTSGIASANITLKCSSKVWSWLLYQSLLLLAPFWPSLEKYLHGLADSILFWIPPMPRTTSPSLHQFLNISPQPGLLSILICKCWCSCSLLVSITVFRTWLMPIFSSSCMELPASILQ